MVLVRTETLGLRPLKRAFDVPEFFKADIGRKAAFGDMIVEHLESDAVGDDRGLADGDIGKRPGVDHARVVLGGTHQGGVDGIAHEGGHGITHFEIAGGHRLAAFVERHGDVVQAFFQIRQILDNRKDGHALGPHCDTEFGLHGITVQTAADADDDIPQGLGTEIDDPAQFHPGGVDVQTPHAGQTLKLFVIVIALMLHAGSQRHHGQVVGIHNVIDITGQTQRKFGHGNQQ